MDRQHGVRLHFRPDTIHRLRFKNLRQGLGQNQLTPEEIESIWQPYVAFTNAKIGQNKFTDLGLMVRREAEPQKFSYEDPVEGD